jgi:hypothetical protein
LFTYFRVSTLILALVFACSVELVLASSPSPQAAPAATTSDSDASNSEAKKLYRRYKKAYDKSIVAIACVRDPKCIEPEDAVLRYSKDALKILQKLDQLAAEGDVQASYYRGLIAYERGQFYDAQAAQITHPDFILTATVYRRYAKEQFALADKYLSIPAKQKNARANQYMGDIYSSAILGAPRKDKAANYYYTAAMAYLDSGNKIDGAKMYNAMKENANPADSRIVQVYARLHNEEPIANWRKLPDELIQSAPKKAQQH